MQAEDRTSMSSVDQTLGPSSIALSSEDERRSFPSAVKSKPVSSDTPRRFLIAISIISAVLVPSRMLLSLGPPDDSAVFAYVGWAMKHGLMPYRDIWDHKGPLLYYLNFAGLTLSPNSTFGIGLLELVSYSIAFFLLYRIVASFSSRLVVLSIAALSVGFVTHFAVGGNMTESWALLPLAAAHYACWRWSQRSTQKWCAVIIGAAFACIFFLRANMVTFPAVAMLVLLYATKRNGGHRSAIRQLTVNLAAVFAVSCAIVAPLYRWRAFHDFVAAYFGYNAAYSGALSLAVRYLHTSQLLILLFATAIAILGTAGWALGIKESIQKQQFAGGLQRVYLQSLLWSLPFEIAAASLSGRDYPHYLLPLAPTLIVLAAWFVSAFEKQSKMIEGKPALIIALFLGFSPFALTAYSCDFFASTDSVHPEYVNVVRFIQSATRPNDRITVVGETEAAYISFMAQRLPASRFVYQLPLIDVNNPIAGEQRKQFMCDIAQNRPAVIVSGNAQVGILCATELECTLRNLQTPATDYGYKAMVLPKLMRDLIASEYQPISDPRFEPFRVLLRKDIPVPSRW